MSYDFENKKNWKPFLSKESRKHFFGADKQIETVQKEPLNYTKPME